MCFDARFYQPYTCFIVKLYCCIVKLLLGCVIMFLGWYGQSSYPYENGGH